MDVSFIERLIWNAKWKSGKLLFHSSTSKATLALHGYTISDRLKIIETLRQIAPEAAQEGWGEFCHLVALPLREGRRVRQPGVEQFDPMTLAEADRVFVTRQYYDRSFGIMFVLSAAVATGLWWLLANPRAFMMPLIVVALWILLRFSLPKAGRWDAKFTARPGGKETAYAYLYVFATIVTMVTLQWIGFDRGIACLVAGALMLPALAWCIRGKFKTANQQRARDTEQASLSIERWNAGNSETATSSTKPVLF